jgi:hypothetical protein
VNQQDCDRIAEQINKRLPKAFDEHLKQCKQCSDHPFALCPVGACLIRLAVTGVKPLKVTGKST